MPGTPSQLRGLLSCSANYANITPVPENAESPSPGYQSGTSPQDAQGQHFMFKVSKHECCISFKKKVVIYWVCLELS